MACASCSSPFGTDGRQPNAFQIRSGTYTRTVTTTVDGDERASAALYVVGADYTVDRVRAAYE